MAGIKTPEGFTGAELSGPAAGGRRRRKNVRGPEGGEEARAREMERVRDMEEARLRRQEQQQLDLERGVSPAGGLGRDAGGAPRDELARIEPEKGAAGGGAAEYVAEDFSGVRALAGSSCAMLRACSLPPPSPSLLPPPMTTLGLSRRHVRWSSGLLAPANGLRWLGQERRSRSRRLLARRRWRLLPVRADPTFAGCLLGLVAGVACCDGGGGGGDGDRPVVWVRFAWSGPLASGAGLECC